MDDETGRGVGQRGPVLGQKQPEAVLIVILRKAEVLHPVPRHDPRVPWVELERRSGELLVRVLGRPACPPRCGIPLVGRTPSSHKTCRSAGAVPDLLRDMAPQAT